MTMPTIAPSKPASSPTPGSAEWNLIELSPVFDLQDLFAIAKRKILWLLLLPLIGAALAIIYLFFFATLYYESKALIFIDPKFDHTLQLENVDSIASDLDSLNSLERAMTSDSMILRVIDKLKLRQDRDFLPKALHKYLDKGLPISDSLLLKQIRSQRVKCALIRPTRLMELVVSDISASRAKLIASTFVVEFESFLGEKKKTEADKSEDVLRRQAAIAYDRALEAEKQLEAFRIENPGLTVEQDHNLFAERLTTVGEELNRVSSKVLDLRSKVETLKDIDPKIDPIQIIEIGGFSDQKHVSDLMSKRMDAKAALAVAAARYTQSHPVYKDAEKQSIEVAAQLEQLAFDLKSSLIGDYNASVTNERLLSESVNQLQKQLNSVKTASSEFRAVQQKVETEWNIHQALQLKIAETALLSEKSTSITTEMSQPIIAHKTSKPGKPIVTIIGFAMGMMVSFSLVGIDLFKDAPYVNKKQIEDSLGVTVLAETPSLHSPDAHRTSLLSQMSQVLLSPQHRLSKITHVTSVEPSNSGSQIGSALGYASAYYGNPTLVISMTPDSTPNSLVSFTPQKAHHEKLYNLVIPSSFLLAPQNIWQLLNPHCRHFSRIIIESTTLDQKSQVPVMISSFSDTSILIVRNQLDKRKKIGAVIENLRKNSKGTISIALEG
jgi:uncharacterized protein involved in exopolysaccharide biosynthesis